MEQLVKQARKGDKEAFVTLMELNKGSLAAAAWTILHNESDVADALQETVLAAFQKLYTLREPKYFKTWLMRILINNCCALLRREKTIQISEYLPEETAAPELDTSLDVRSSLEELCDGDRLVLTLFYLNDLSQKEIGALLGITENAVKKRIARGKRHFRSAYEKGEACNERP